MPQLSSKELLILRQKKGIPHSRLVTVNIPAGNLLTRVPFDDQPDLRYARILGMEVLYVRELAQSSPLNLPLIPAQAFRLIAVTLETNDTDQLEDPGTETGRFGLTGKFIQQPLCTFHRFLFQGNPNTQAPAVMNLVQFYNTFVIWQKCYLTITNPQALSGAAVCFNVYYTTRSVFGKKIPQR